MVANYQLPYLFAPPNYVPSFSKPRANWKRIVRYYLRTDAWINIRVGIRLSVSVFGMIIFCLYYRHVFESLYMANLFFLVTFADNIGKTAQTVFFNVIALSLAILVPALSAYIFGISHLSIGLCMVFSLTIIPLSFGPSVNQGQFKIYTSFCALYFVICLQKGYDTEHFMRTFYVMISSCFLSIILSILPFPLAANDHMSIISDRLLSKTARLLYLVSKGFTSDSSMVKKNNQKLSHTMRKYYKRYKSQGQSPQGQENRQGPDIGQPHHGHHDHHHHHHHHHSYNNQQHPYSSSAYLTQPQQGVQQQQQQQQPSSFVDPTMAHQGAYPGYPGAYQAAPPPHELDSTLPTPTPEGYMSPYPHQHSRIEQGSSYAPSLVDKLRGVHVPRSVKTKRRSYHHATGPTPHTSERGVHGGYEHAYATTSQVSDREARLQKQLELSGYDLSSTAGAFNTIAAPGTKGSRPVQGLRPNRSTGILNTMDAHPLSQSHQHLTGIEQHLPADHSQTVYLPPSALRKPQASLRTPAKTKGTVRLNNRDYVYEMTDKNEKHNLNFTDSSDDDGNDGRGSVYDVRINNTGTKDASNTLYINHNRSAHSLRTLETTSQYANSHQNNSNPLDHHGVSFDGGNDDDDDNDDDDIDDVLSLATFGTDSSSLSSVHTIGSGNTFGSGHPGHEQYMQHEHSGSNLGSYLRQNPSSQNYQQSSRYQANEQYRDFELSPQPSRDELDVFMDSSSSSSSSSPPSSQHSDDDDDNTDHHSQPRQTHKTPILTAFDPPQTEDGEGQIEAAGAVLHPYNHTATMQAADQHTEYSRLSQLNNSIAGILGGPQSIQQHPQSQQQYYPQHPYQHQHPHLITTPYYNTYDPNSHLYLPTQQHQQQQLPYHYNPQHDSHYHQAHGASPQQMTGQYQTYQTHPYPPPQDYQYPHPAMGGAGGGPPMDTSGYYNQDTSDEHDILDELELFSPFPQIYTTEANSVIEDMQTDISLIQKLAMDAYIESVLYRIFYSIFCCCILKHLRSRQQSKLDYPENHLNLHHPDPIYPTLGSHKRAMGAPYSAESIAAFAADISSVISNARGMLSALTSMSTSLSRGGVILYHLHTHYLEKDMRNLSKLYKLLILNAKNKNPDLTAIDGAFIDSMEKIQRKGGQIDVFSALYDILYRAHKGLFPRVQRKDVSTGDTENPTGDQNNNHNNSTNPNSADPNSDPNGANKTDEKTDDNTHPSDPKVNIIHTKSVPTRTKKGKTYSHEKQIRKMSFVPGTYAAVSHLLRNFWHRYSIIRQVAFFGVHDTKKSDPLFVYVGKSVPQIPRQFPLSFLSDGLRMPSGKPTTAGVGAGPGHVSGSLPSKTASTLASLPSKRVLNSFRRGIESFESSWQYYRGPQSSTSYTMMHRGTLGGLGGMAGQGQYYNPSIQPATSPTHYGGGGGFGGGGDTGGTIYPTNQSISYPINVPTYGPHSKTNHNILVSQYTTNHVLHQSKTHSPRQYTITLNDLISISTFFFNFDRYICRMLHNVLPHSLPHMYRLQGIHSSLPATLTLGDDGHYLIPQLDSFMHQTGYMPDGARGAEGDAAAQASSDQHQQQYQQQYGAQGMHDAPLAPISENNQSGHLAAALSPQQPLQQSQQPTNSDTRVKSPIEQLFTPPSETSDVSSNHTDSLDPDTASQKPLTLLPSSSVISSSHGTQRAVSEKPTSLGSLVIHTPDLPTITSSPPEQENAAALHGHIHGHPTPITPLPPLIAGLLPPSSFELPPMVPTLTPDPALVNQTLADVELIKSNHDHQPAVIAYNPDIAPGIIGPGGAVGSAAASDEQMLQHIDSSRGPVGDLTLQIAGVPREYPSQQYIPPSNPTPSITGLTPVRPIYSVRDRQGVSHTRTFLTKSNSSVYASDDVVDVSSHHHHHQHSTMGMDHGNQSLKRIGSRVNQMDPHPAQYTMLAPPNVTYISRAPLYTTSQPVVSNQVGQGPVSTTAGIASPPPLPHVIFNTADTLSRHSYLNVQPPLPPLYPPPMDNYANYTTNNNLGPSQLPDVELYRKIYPIYAQPESIVNKYQGDGTTPSDPTFEMEPLYTMPLLPPSFRPHTKVLPMAPPPSYFVPSTPVTFDQIYALLLPYWVQYVLAMLRRIFFPPKPTRKTDVAKVDKTTGALSIVRHKKPSSRKNRRRMKWMRSAVPPQGDNSAAAAASGQNDGTTGSNGLNRRTTTTTTTTTTNPTQPQQGDAPVVVVDDGIVPSLDPALQPSLNPSYTDDDDDDKSITIIIDTAPRQTNPVDNAQSAHQHPGGIGGTQEVEMVSPKPSHHQVSDTLAHGGSTTAAAPLQSKSAPIKQPTLTDQQQQQVCDTDVIETVIVSSSSQAMPSIWSRIRTEWSGIFSITPSQSAYYKAIYKSALAIHLSCLIALIPSSWDKSEYVYWAGLTSALVISGEHVGGSLQNILFRIQGTVLGAMYGYFTNLLIREFYPGLEDGGIYLLAFMCSVFCLLFAYYRASPHGNYSVANTAMVTCLVTGLGAVDGDFSKYTSRRIEMTTLGAIATLIIAYLVWPQKSDTMVLKNISDVLKESHSILQLNFQLLNLTSKHQWDVSATLFGPSLLPATSLSRKVRQYICTPDGQPQPSGAGDLLPQSVAPPDPMPQSTGLPYPNNTPQRAQQEQAFCQCQAIRQQQLHQAAASSQTRASLDDPYGIYAGDDSPSARLISLLSAIREHILAKTGNGTMTIDAITTQNATSNELFSPTPFSPFSPSELTPMPSMLSAATIDTPVPRNPSLDKTDPDYSSFHHPFCEHSELRLTFKALFPAAVLPRTPLQFMSMYDNLIRSKFAALRNRIHAQSILTATARKETAVIGKQSNKLVIHHIMECQLTLVRLLSRLHECLFTHQTCMAQIPKIDDILLLQNEISKGSNYNPAQYHPLLNQQLQYPQDASQNTMASSPTYLYQNVMVSNAFILDKSTEALNSFNDFARCASHLISLLISNVNKHVEFSQIETLPVIGLPCVAKRKAIHFDDLSLSPINFDVVGDANTAPNSPTKSSDTATVAATTATPIRPKSLYTGWFCVFFGFNCGPFCIGKMHEDQDEEEIVPLLSPDHRDQRQSRDLEAQHISPNPSQHMTADTHEQREQQQQHQQEEPWLSQAAPEHTSHAEPLDADDADGPLLNLSSLGPHGNLSTKEPLPHATKTSSVASSTAAAGPSATTPAPSVSSQQLPRASHEEQQQQQQSHQQSQPSHSAPPPAAAALPSAPHESTLTSHDVHLLRNDATYRRKFIQDVLVRDFWKHEKLYQQRFHSNDEQLKIRELFHITTKIAELYEETCQHRLYVSTIGGGYALMYPSAFALIEQTFMFCLTVLPPVLMDLVSSIHSLKFD